MSGVLEHVSFRRVLTDKTILSAIAQANPDVMSEVRYKEVSGYFSDFCRAKSINLSYEGDHPLARIYSHAANVLADIVDDRSMRIKASQWKSLFVLLYFREDSFRAFIDKFSPDLMTVTQAHMPLATAYKPEKIDPSKIVEFKI